MPNDDVAHSVAFEALEDLEGLKNVFETPGATIGRARITFEPTLPEWWNWELSFTGHAELRMAQRSVTEVDVRAMLEHATTYEPSVVEGRFMIRARHQQHAWVVIVEPDVAAKLLVVVTAYEVSQ